MTRMFFGVSAQVQCVEMNSGLQLVTLTHPSPSGRGRQTARSSGIARTQLKTFSEDSFSLREKARMRVASPAESFSPIREIRVLRGSNLRFCRASLFS